MPTKKKPTTKKSTPIKKPPTPMSYVRCVCPTCGTQLPIHAGLMGKPGCTVEGCEWLNPISAIRAT